MAGKSNKRPKTKSRTLASRRRAKDMSGAMLDKLHERSIGAEPPRKGTLNVYGVLFCTPVAMMLLPIAAAAQMICGKK